MTSRERVRAVLDRRIPDRVPFGLGGCETAGLHLLAYEKIKEILNVESKPTRLDTFMLNAIFEQNMLVALEGDIILLASPIMCGSTLWGSGVEKDWKEQLLWGKKFRVPIKEEFINQSDGSMIWKSAGGAYCPAGGIYFDIMPNDKFNLNFETPSPDAFNPPAELPDALLRRLEETAKSLYESTDFSICCGETITDLQVSPAGFMGTFMLMKEEPDIMHEFLEKAVNAALSQLRQLEQAIGKYVDILSIAHDFGDNRGITMGSNLWREIYKPHYKKLFSGWKKITNMKINLHSCGSIHEILPDLIECGVDIYNPVQTSAASMDADSIKKEFGKKIIFYGGGYDAQATPKNADYNTVYNIVKKNIETLSCGGGYIFAGVHNLPGDTPKHHLTAMLDAWKDTRDY